MTSYNGWTNRETWAANLWITNDPSMYYHAKEVVQICYEDRTDFDTPADVTAGPALKEWWESLTDPDEGLMSAEDILKMVRDIGDEDKINWQEIAESLLSE